MKAAIQEKIALSFTGKPVVKSSGNYTFASVTSYLKRSTLSRIFGSVNIPDFIVNILNKNGYTYDSSLDGWAKKVTASIFLSPNDKDDPVKASNISRTKVKCKAYKSASRVLGEICASIGNMRDISYMSFGQMIGLWASENEALGRCRETGYCDPAYNHQKERE